MPDTSPGEKIPLVVLTSGQWSLNDVQKFARAVDRLHGIMLALRLATERVVNRSPLGWNAKLADYLLSPGFRDLPGAQWSPEPMHKPTWVSPVDLPFGPEVRYLEFLFQNRYTFAPEARPCVQSWVMASPGSISIQGFGDIMLQLREFIKDMTYRNRQEEVLGELEIARKRIELEGSVLSPPAVDYMAAQLLLEYTPLRLLEERSKLLPPTSYEAHYERFIRHLQLTAAKVKELKPLLRRASGLAKPNARGWEKRVERLQVELRELFHADKVDEDSYNQLYSSLRALTTARHPQI